MILCFLLSLALAAVSFAQEPADSLQRVSREAPAEAQASGEQTAEQLWNKANTAYINGDYHAAIATYGELLDRGYSSAKLYFNLGNACFKEGETGRAILCYHRRCAWLRATTTSATTFRSPSRGRRTGSRRFPSFSLRNGCVPCATR